MTERLRWLPAVHACLADPPAAVRALDAGARLEKSALEEALSVVRSALRENPARFDTATAVESAVAERWVAELAGLLRPALGRVVNATGVVVHTNLGRAPLAPPALEAARAAGAGYTPLEYDVERGERGSRYVHAARLLKLLTGAEDALVVNNNAAALLLAVDTLAGGRAVVISRGELIEIGGGFRVHEIIARSSARIVEVGATNKTHFEDYARALDEHDVGAILKVHRSNFRVAGFVAEVELAELCGMGEARSVPVVFDQGTGLLEPHPAAPGGPTIRDAREAGAAIACGSGDKLLGGPQAGLLCGGRDQIAKMRANPLLRALRVDKGTLAALEATLRLTLSDPDAVPVRAMLAAGGDDLRARAEALRARLSPPARAQCEVRAHAGRAGGGTLPEEDLPSWAVRVVPRGMTAAALEAALRAGDPPVVARVADGAVWLDVRTLQPGDDEVIARRLDPLLVVGGPS
ncbi:L-seryl-tRNA(Sec) selenium transferase [soil metagenome]